MNLTREDLIAIATEAIEKRRRTEARVARLRRRLKSASGALRCHLAIRRNGRRDEWAVVETLTMQCHALGTLDDVEQWIRSQEAAR